MSRITPRVLALAASTVLASGALASTAAAAPSNASKTRTSTSSKPTSSPKPKAKPAKATPRLFLPDAFAINRNLLTVTNRVVHADGVVRPYVPGQWVKVEVYLGNTLIKTDHLRQKPSKRRVYGGFSERIVTSGAGLVTVKITHQRNSKQVGFVTLRRYAVVAPYATFGSSGRFVQLIQSRLQALHFYLPQSGVYDGHTGLAVDAYHRLLGWGTSQLLGPATVNSILNGDGAFAVRYPTQGVHAEGDLTHQLLALINGSSVQWIFPISSGKPSTPTVLGNFRVYQRTPGYLPDGMYYSSFFTGGYAIHGFDPAPDYPASHGCMRLPIMDAIFVYDWLNYGDGVDVYYR